MKLSGTGKLKHLTWNDCVIHDLPPEAGVCKKFVEELTKIKTHSIVYRGESLAGFNQIVFDELCKNSERPPITRNVKQAVKGNSDGLCVECGDEIVQEIDHTIPRSCFGSDDLSHYMGVMYSMPQG